MMKKILLILFCFISVFANAQNQGNVIVALGEYNCGIVRLSDSSQRDLTDGSNGLPVVGTGLSGVKVINAWFGPHDWFYLGSDSTVWTRGQNHFNDAATSTTYNKMLTDSAGVALPKFKKVIPFYTGALFITSDGTKLGLVGNADKGMRGITGYADAVFHTKIVWITLPGGELFKDVAYNGSVVAVAQSGKVYTWGTHGDQNGLEQYHLGQGGASSSDHPVQITIPGSETIVEAQGDDWNCILKGTSHWFAFGYHTGLIGYANDNTHLNTPTDITSLLFPVANVQSWAMSSHNTYIVKTDGTLWGVGDQESNQLGDGVGLDFSEVSMPAFPYAWNESVMTTQNGYLYNQFGLKQICPGKSNFTKVFAGNTIVYYMYAMDANYDLFSWGRNKRSVNGSGIVDAVPANGNISATYPMSWQIQYPMRVTDSIYTRTTSIWATSPYCTRYPSGAPCNIYSNPVAAAPTNNPGSNQTITGTTATLSMTAAAAANTLLQYSILTLVSGPPGAQIPIQQFQGTSFTANLYNMITNGLYTFQLMTMDQNWRSVTSTVTVFKTDATPPPCTTPGCILRPPWSTKLN